MNSRAKSRISARAARILPPKLLYAMRAGTAATRPAAVLMRASAIPGATTTIDVEPFWAICENAIMMPITVPKRPMNGVAEAVVARNDSPRVRRVVSTPAARSRARSMDARLFTKRRPVPAAAAPPLSGPLLPRVGGRGGPRAKNPGGRPRLALVAEAEDVGELAALAE